jgi:hypothetical protein
MTTDTTTTTTVDTRYVDPNGVRYVLALNPDTTGPDNEATVTQHRDDRTRVVATGPADALRAMLTTWAEGEGGELTGAPEVVASFTLPEGTTGQVQNMRRALGDGGLVDLAEVIYRDLLPVVDRSQVEGGGVFFDGFCERTGWDDLFSAMMEVAGALLVAAGAHDGDLVHPQWIREDDRQMRDALAWRGMVAAHPELAAALSPE